MSSLSPERPSSPPNQAPTAFANPEPETTPEANRAQKPSFPLWGWMGIVAAGALALLYVVARVAGS